MVLCAGRHLGIMECGQMDRHKQSLESSKGEKLSIEVLNVEKIIIN